MSKEDTPGGRAAQNIYSIGASRRQRRARASGENFIFGFFVFEIFDVPSLTARLCISVLAPGLFDEFENDRFID